MCDSYDNPQLLNQYDDNNNDTNESKENQSNCDYCCNQDHLMCNMNGKHSGKCILCDELCNMIEYQCIQCDEYVCKTCNKHISQLNRMLKMKQFKQFDEKISKYNERNKILKLVELLFEYNIFFATHKN